jgi:DNA invertase Pin-like site-specific DNA recombinase
MQVFGYTQHALPFDGNPEVDTQRRAIAAHASERGLSVTVWFEDGSRSSKTPLADRPAGGRLCRQVQPGDHVLVMSAVLLCPSLRDLEWTVADWHQRGITFHCYYQSRDVWLDTGVTESGVNCGELFLHVFEAVRAMRSAAIREDVLSRRLQRKRNGRCSPWA